MITIKKFKNKKKCSQVKCPYFNLITVKCMFCEWDPDVVSVVKKED